MKSFKICIVGLILAFSACKERYTPETASIDNNMLVVEGFLNTGADSTYIKLSRTVTLAKKTTVNPEIGATLTIETSANETRILVEKEKGLYVAPPLNFGSNKKYRLKIKTKNGSNYQSDFVEAIPSPQIDSLNYAVKPNGVQLYVNASDPTNKTRYYRWEYEESWIFYAQFNATSKWDGGPNVVDRPLEESVFKCWGNANSSTIVIGSSIKLNKDVIHLGPITDIASTSEKITEKYSILVKQYALTKEAYEFWENLKKNTESLGSIFDVLPSQLTGNIHNTANADEPVIGYISAGTVQKQRLFISKEKLPNWRPVFPFECMLLDTVKIKDQVAAFTPRLFVPVEAARDDSGRLMFVLGAARRCADCTVRGTTKKPSFWQ